MLQTYQLRTTQRLLVIRAESPDQARAFVQRLQNPPEPFPTWPGDQCTGEERDAWWAARATYFERWPRLAWEHGECLIGIPVEVAPESEAMQT